MAIYREGNVHLQVDILEDLSTETHKEYSLEVTDIIVDGNPSYFLGQTFICEKPAGKKGKLPWSLEES